MANFKRTATAIWNGSGAEGAGSLSGPSGVLDMTPYSAAKRFQNEDGKADGWHYQRQSSLCEESPMDGKYCIRFENKDSTSISQGLQGTAINGRAIRAIQLDYWVRCSGIIPGNSASEQAAVVVHFYDHVRREIGTTVLGKWRGSFAWQNAKSTVIVPPNARELIIRIGLNGAQGQLDLDDMQMTTTNR